MIWQKIKSWFTKKPVERNEGTIWSAKHMSGPSDDKNYEIDITTGLPKEWANWKNAAFVTSKQPMQMYQANSPQALTPEINELWSRAKSGEMPEEGPSIDE